MQKRVRSKYIRGFFAAVFAVMCLAPPVHQLAAAPADIEVPVGEQTVVPLRLPTDAQVSSSNASIVHAKTITSHRPVSHDLAVISRDVGDAYVSTKLFGFLPWKTLRVHVVPQEMVYVGGQSIGVRLHSNGVIVVGFQRVGDGPSPAADSDLRIGDVIEGIGNHSVTTAEDLRRYSNTEQPIHIQVRRGDTHRWVDVQPKADENGEHHLGLFVREKTSGVGTLTFYEPDQHRFGALGHVITDADTGQVIQGKGSLFEASVTGLVRGAVGKPGEKRGRFVDNNREIGHIEENSSYGVFGTMGERPSHPYLDTEVPVALPSQVRTGPAKMLTVIHDQKVEEFSVEIENIAKQEEPNTKSMIVHVTDPRLLQDAGGIVQGMSGSPILQDGKLIGAVTHVFVSDPTRGYGVYAAWMLKECNKNEQHSGIESL